MEKRILCPPPSALRTRTPAPALLETHSIPTPDSCTTLPKRTMASCCPIMLHQPFRSVGPEEDVAGCGPTAAVSQRKMCGLDTECSRFSFFRISNGFGKSAHSNASISKESSPRYILKTRSWAKGSGATMEKVSKDTASH